MNFEDINFPVYRRYKNRRSYFKIINPTFFEEIQLVGSKKIVKQIEAKLFPEKIFIRDLLFNYDLMADEITEEDYQNQR